MTAENLLSIVLLSTNVFWAVLCVRLINRLMSRNYYEFKDAEATAERIKAKSNVPNLNDEITEDQALGAVNEILQ